MKKIADKILNITIVLLIIFGLVSYHLILPMKMVRAGEESAPETKVDSGSSSSSSESDEDENEDKDEDKDEDSSDEDASDEEDATDQKVSVQETNDEETKCGEGEEETASATAVNNPSSSALQQDNPTGLETLLPTASFGLNQEETDESDECICEKDNITESDCENPCPEECQCCVDYCAGIVSQNAAEDLENVAGAVSATGGNLIEGMAADNLVSGSQPAGEENNLEPEDENNSDESGEDSSEEDQAESVESQAVISTGNAAAQVAAVNEVNTNIYTENGVQVVENITGDSEEDINLISTFENVLEEAQNLNLENQEFFEQVSITNINAAENIENTVIAQADSGTNSIENVSGSASIETGDSKAAASAVNFINTNIVGNNWLMAVVNVAGNWSGDLIVPGKGLIKTPSAGMIFEKVTSVNLAENISNFISASANTGSNLVNSVMGSSKIETGSADSSASGTNIVNTNLVQNNWFFLMINNSGNWLGKVINWDSETEEQRNAYEYEFGNIESDSYISDYGKSVSVYNYNSASDVSNTVIADANTGGNTVSEAESAEISTGDASASASALNFINTNITGNNWFMAVVNVAGEWTGDVIFGYPDLEVALSADKNSVQPGDDLNFTVHYKNVGQAKCANVNLMLSLPDYLSGSGNYVLKDGNNFYWSVGELEPGEEGSFSFKALLSSNIPSSVASLEAAVGAKTDTEEKEFSNNYDGEKINIIFPQINSNVTIMDGDVISADDSKLKIERSEESRVAIGEISSHKITVKNNGKNVLYNLEVKEKIKDPSGSKVAEYVWPIAQLKKGQSAFIEYQIFADPSAKLGTYEHSASSIAYDEAGNKIESGKAKKLVEFVSGSFGSPVYSENSGGDVPAAGNLETFENSMPEVLGAAISNQKSVSYFWLLLLLVLPIAYVIWKKRLYEREKITGLIRQTASAIFSFFF